jgi:hypothetical protein
MEKRLLMCGNWFVYGNMGKHAWIRCAFIDFLLRSSGELLGFWIWIFSSISASAVGGVRRGDCRLLTQQAGNSPHCESFQSNFPQSQRKLQTFRMKNF